MLQQQQQPPQPGRPPPAGETDDFLRDLRHFHEVRGTPFRRSPTLGGHVVDLRLLYDLVTAEGGWVKVNAKNSWSELLRHFHLPTSSVNGSVALKQIYLRYLDRWEKAHLGGDEADRAEDDDYDDDASRHKRPGAAASARHLHAVPHYYNHQQHQVAVGQREFHQLSTELYPFDGWEYERLLLSLSSPLPNEQDFALNACTLLSNDGRPGRTLRLDRYPKILDHLLAHAHVYSHGSLRQLFTHYYKDVRRRPARSFWKDAIESREFLFLSRESRFCGEPSESVDLDELEDDDDDDEEDDEEDEEESASDAEEAPQPRKFIADSPEDDELFCLKRSLGTQDYVGQRVLQVATILRNLCYAEENVPVLARNKTFVRFLLLCAASKWNNLKNLGMDMLGNVAAEYALPGDAALARALLNIVARNLASEDRARCVSSLEALNRLSQNEANEEALVRALGADAYRRVCSFLTIHDVMLLIYTLECLYALSSLGERACSLIATARHGIVGTLVALVTVEGKSYGPRACIGMKLVETVPGGAQAQQGAAAPPAKPTAPPPQAATPVRTVTIAPQRLATVTVTATPTPIAPARAASTPPPPPPAPAAVSVPAAAPPAAPPASASLASLTPQQAIAQAHAQQQAVHEDERFALAWLRATYEPAPAAAAGGGSPRIDHRELYRLYMASCGRLGRRGVISPLHFPRCVRSVFGGTVGPNPIRGEPQFYDGIRQRAQPLLLPQLTAAESAAAATVQQGANQPPAQQSLAQQQGSTSLIKSLLATKVKEEQQPQCMRAVATVAASAQVAARQQRLQMGKESSSRPNGVRLFPADEEPSRPPPLAPLSDDGAAVLPNGVPDDAERPQPLRLADLLERSLPPAALTNGHERADLVEDRIEKALSGQRPPPPPDTMEIKIELKEELLEAEVIEKPGAKRQAEGGACDGAVEGKRARLSVNGANSEDSSSGGGGGGGEESGGPSSGVSNAAAKLFADMAADILEDEDEEQLLAVVPAGEPCQPPAPVQRFAVDGGGGAAAQIQRQIVAAPTAVLVQAAARPAAGAPLVIQGGGGAPLVLQTAAGPVQLVAGPGGGGGGGVPAAATHYVLQSGQRQQAAGAPNTIIILQQPGQQAQHHQKVMVTPQGQQVVVTQVARSAAGSATIRQTKSPTAATNGERPRPVKDLTTPYVCEWGNCAVDTKFKSANEVYMHVCARHCPEAGEEVTCQWDRCDNMKRKRFSLMTHLHDKHCNAEAMRQSLSRRKQVAAGGAKAEAPAPAPPPAPHPGYAPDAALHAIKRHALEFANPKELQDDNEGPVTKSIRLTAALILRNLAIYNGQSRRYLKAYESHLANVALSNVESSRTVAQILYDINDVPGPR